MQWAGTVGASNRRRDADAGSRRVRQRGLEPSRLPPELPRWEGGLASIMLEGPCGSITLDGETDLPMSIVRDSRTDQVRGFLRDPPVTTAAGDRADAGRTRPREAIQPRSPG